MNCKENYLKQVQKMSKIVELTLEKKHPKYFDSVSGAKKHLQERSLEEDEY